MDINTINVKFSDRISAISAGVTTFAFANAGCREAPEIAWRIRRLQGMAKNLGYIMPLDKAIDLNEFDRVVAGKDVGTRPAWQAEASNDCWQP